MTKLIPLEHTCRNVLVADDIDDTRAFLRALMESWGCSVVEAPNGLEAVEIVRHRCPDLILLDLNMPKLDGLATAEKIRQLKGRYELVPIIAITAFDTYGMEEAAIDAGCSGYVRKPIHEDEFERVVRRLFPLSF